MKLDLKINYSKLDTLHTHTVHYIQALGDAADAIKKVQRELKKHDSKALDQVCVMGERILKRYEEVLSALEDIKKSIHDYRTEMYDIIKAKAYHADVRVDYLDLGANVVTIVARSLQFYDIPTDIEGNCLSVVLGEPSKLQVAAGIVVMATLDKITQQKNGYFQTLLEIKTNKMPACAGKIDTEAKRLNKILKAAQDFQGQDIYHAGKAGTLYLQYTDTIEFYEDLRRYKMKQFEAQLEGAWDSLVNFVAGIGDIATTYFPAIPASLEFLLKKNPSDWAIDSVDKANAKTDALKAYLKDPLSLVETISQQATDTLDKKGSAYAVAYVVTDLVVMEVAFQGLAKAAKAVVGKSDEIAKVVSKTDDVVKGAGRTDDVIEGAAKTSKGGSKTSTGIENLLNNRAELTGTTREKLLSTVQDSELAKIVNELYRPGATVGDGGTASILVEEFYNGSSKHLIKATERLKQLKSLSTSGKLGLNDLDVVAELINDLESAIKLFD